MINLCLVVIATQFSETKKRETERMIAERKRFSPTSSTILSDFGQQEPGSCWTELLNLLTHILKKAKRNLISQYMKSRSKTADKMEAAENRLKFSQAKDQRKHLKTSVRLKLNVYRYHMTNHQKICRGNKAVKVSNSSSNLNNGNNKEETQNQESGIQNYLAAHRVDTSFKKRTKVGLLQSFDVNDQTFETESIKAVDASDVKMSGNVEAKCERILRECEMSQIFMESLIDQSVAEAADEEVFYEGSERSLSQSRDVY